MSMILRLHKAFKKPVCLGLFPLLCQGEDLVFIALALLLPRRDPTGHPRLLQAVPNSPDSLHSVKGPRQKTSCPTPCYVKGMIVHTMLFWYGLTK